MNHSGSMSTAGMLWDCRLRHRQPLPVLDASDAHVADMVPVVTDALDDVDPTVVPTQESGGQPTTFRDPAVAGLLVLEWATRATGQQLIEVGEARSLASRKSSGLASVTGDAKTNRKVKRHCV